MKKDSRKGRRSESKKGSTRKRCTVGLDLAVER
jgi:hypothetical protein